MILLAIDPGYAESHYVYFDDYSRKVLAVGSKLNDDLLTMLREQAGRNLPPPQDLAVIESMDPFGLRLGRETMDTILWIGRFQEASRGELVPRSLVKMTLCGNRKADDAAIRRVLIDRLGKPGTSKKPGPTYGVSGHRWQALAVAVTWLETRTESEEAPTSPVAPAGPQPDLFTDRRG